MNIKCKGWQCIGFWLLGGNIIIWSIIALTQVSYADFQKVFESSLISGLISALLTVTITVGGMWFIDKRAEKRWLKENQTKKVIDFMIQLENLFAATKSNFRNFNRYSLSKGITKQNLFFHFYYLDPLGQSCECYDKLNKFILSNSILYDEFTKDLSCNINCIMALDTFILDLKEYVDKDLNSYENIVYTFLQSYHIIDKNRRLDSLFKMPIPKSEQEKEELFHAFIQEGHAPKFFALVQEDLDIIYKKIASSKHLKYYKEAIN